MARSHLPRQPTPFIGRKRETADIVDRLGDPGCRLLTLIGPGGIGKTRLALQAAGQPQVDFADGKLFVDLQSAPVEAAEALLTAVADACKLPLSGQDAPRQQLLSYLANKEVLLVLDHFEPFLADGILAESIALLGGILENAPAVKILATSRSALNLQEEWLYPMQGLSVPPDSADEIMDYTAVQLFVERARRIRPDFAPDEQREGLVRVCRLVDGMPLALELAASWTKMLSCKAIAAEIQRNLDFLKTTLRDIPERHRSMQAVFEQSWTLLSPSEQNVFARLSVFRGGFTRTAAAEIAEATLPILSALVDKSLLGWADGRYWLHELSRQHAAEKLVQSPDAVERTRDHHATFFVNFLQARRDDLMGGRQQAATLEIERERENVRLAWHWAVDRGNHEQISKAVQPLSFFYQFQSRYREGLLAFSAALKELTEETCERLLLLLELAWFQIRLGRLHEAEEALAQCQSIYERLNTLPVAGHGTDPRLALGIIASVRGDYAKVARFAEEARRTAESQMHQWNQQFAYYLLGRVAFVQGDYEAAEQYAEKAYATARKIGDRWFMAYCLNELGNAASAQSSVEVAKEHYGASYAIREEFNDPEGMALALVHLGDVSSSLTDFAEARRLYERSRQIYQEIGDHGGLAMALNGIGKTAAAQGDNEHARRLFGDALQIAADIGYLPLILSIFVGVGQLWVEGGRPERGVALLALAQRHPAGETSMSEQAQEQLRQARSELAPETYRAATEEHVDEQLMAVTETVLAELAASAVEVNTVRETDGTPAQAEREQPLVEPLTERELEVLHLIAQGHTNQEVADELVISLGTVKWYTSQIYGKLDVSNRTAAVARARELTLL